MLWHISKREEDVIKDISACSNSAFCLVSHTFVVASEYFKFVLDMSIPVYCHIELLLLLIESV